METKKLKGWQKIGYGLGDFGGNITYTAISAFVLVYCTNVLGLSAAVIGTLIMLSKFLDGISDMIMGVIIDRTRSKAGKARFWVMVSAIPMAVTTFLLFNIPGSFTENTKYVYFFIVYLLMSAVFYTMSNIAYSAMVALVTKDPQDQVSLYSMRMIFAMVGVMVFSFATMSGVEAFGGGQQGWRMMALIYSVIGGICLMLPAICIKELPQNPAEAAATGAVSSKKVGFWESVKLLLQYKYFLVIFFIYLANYLISGLSASGMVYYASYILNNPNLMGFLSLTTYLPIIILLPFVSRLIPKFKNMRQALLVGSIAAVAGSVLILAGGWAGFGVLMAGLVVRAIGTLPGSATFGPLTAISEENLFLTTGRRITGMYFSCSSVSQKIGMGLGTAIYGWLLEASGFNGMEAVQTVGAISTIRLLYVLPPLIGTVLSVVLYALLDVEDANNKLMNKKAV